MERVRFQLQSLVKGNASASEPHAVKTVGTIYGIDLRTKFTIAVLGPSGVGKSAVINKITNALRRDSFFAPLNSREREYYPRVYAWHALCLIDIPEVPPRIEVSEYFQAYHLSTFDLLVFVGQDGRLTTVDLDLIDISIQQQCPAVFVNTKIDISCANFRNDEDVDGNVPEAALFEEIKTLLVSTPPLTQLRLPIFFVNASSRQRTGFDYENERFLEHVLGQLKSIADEKSDVMPSLMALRSYVGPSSQTPSLPNLPSIKMMLLPPLRQHDSNPADSVPLAPKSQIQQVRNGSDEIKANPGKWTAEEDERLRAAVERHGPRNWKAIAKMVQNRNHAQCLQRWRKVLLPGLRRGNWSHEEDVLLQSQIQLHGGEAKLNWAAVAAGVPGRTAKHCQERWRNYLNPNIKRGPFDQEERDLLTQLYAQWGNQWTRISESIPGRCPVDCKTNWFIMHPEHKLNQRPGPGRPKLYG
ncbi:hypothetical protein LEN26_011220 [Aphanomyces euteiches]|nr:hypothetical protein LEN26_011220 [Aphanomyces euteiches]